MKKKIAFVDGNRAINKNNVKKHVESLKKFGTNLVPLLYVEATEVEGRILYDAKTGEVVAPEDYSKYWVILDGQHRYKAAQELVASIEASKEARKESGDEAGEEANDFTMDALKWEKVEMKDGLEFEDYLIEVNTRTQPWKGADYICGCVLQHPENEAVQFAQELINEGVSGKTVAKYLFFKEIKWSDAVKDASLLAKADVDRANEIWEVVKKFPLIMKKSPIIIDLIISNGNWQEDLRKIDALTEEQKVSFETLKQGQLKDKLDQLLASFDKKIAA